MGGREDSVREFMDITLLVTMRYSGYILDGKEEDEKRQGWSVVDIKTMFALKEGEEMREKSDVL